MWVTVLGRGYDVLPDVESSYWPAGGGEDFFPNSLAHKICTQLRPQSDEAVVLRTKIGDLDVIANCITLSPRSMSHSWLARQMTLPSSPLDTAF